MYCKAQLNDNKVSLKTEKWKEKKWQMRNPYQ